MKNLTIFLCLICSLSVSDLCFASEAGSVAVFCENPRPGQNRFELLDTVILKATSQRAYLDDFKTLMSRLSTIDPVRKEQYEDRGSAFLGSIEWSDVELPLLAIPTTEFLPPGCRLRQISIQTSRDGKIVRHQLDRMAWDALPSIQQSAVVVRELATRESLERGLPNPSEVSRKFLKALLTGVDLHAGWAVWSTGVRGVKRWNEFVASIGLGHSYPLYFMVHDRWRPADAEGSAFQFVLDTSDRSTPVQLEKGVSFESFTINGKKYENMDGRYSWRSWRDGQTPAFKAGVLGHDPVISFQTQKPFELSLMDQTIPQVVEWRRVLNSSTEEGADDHKISIHFLGELNWKLGPFDVRLKDQMSFGFRSNQPWDKNRYVFEHGVLAQPFVFKTARFSVTCLEQIEFNGRFMFCSNVTDSFVRVGRETVSVKALTFDNEHVFSFVPSGR